MITSLDIKGYDIDYRDGVMRSPNFTKNGQVYRIVADEDTSRPQPNYLGDALIIQDGDDFDGPTVMMIPRNSTTSDEGYFDQQVAQIADMGMHAYINEVNELGGAVYEIENADITTIVVHTPRMDALMGIANDDQMARWRRTRQAAARYESWALGDTWSLCVEVLDNDGEWEETGIPEDGVYGLDGEDADNAIRYLIDQL